uniref:Uncharacterized protein n=1 Tax=Culex quinquefasciatus TaxID=7176 RepID=A0A1S4KIC3_CULQU
MTVLSHRNPKFTRILQDQLPHRCHLLVTQMVEIVHGSGGQAKLPGPGPCPRQHHTNVFVLQQGEIRRTLTGFRKRAILATNVDREEVFGLGQRRTRDQHQNHQIETHCRTWLRARSSGTAQKKLPN